MESLRNHLLKKVLIYFKDSNIKYVGDSLFLLSNSVELECYKGYNSRIKNIDDFCNVTVDLFLEYLDKMFVYGMGSKHIFLRLDNGFNYRKSNEIVSKVIGSESSYKKLLSSYKSLNKLTSIKCYGDIIGSDHDRLGVRYIWKMKIEYKGKQYTFKYTNSINNGNNVPDIKDCVYALISDRQAFLSSRNLEDFYHNFCSEDMTAGEVQSLYNVCEKTSMALERILGSDLAWFEEFFNDY